MNLKPWYVINPYTGELEDEFSTHEEALEWAYQLAGIFHLVGLERRYKIRRSKSFI